MGRSGRSHERRGPNRRARPSAVVPAMEDKYILREKALRLAIRTGVAPDLDFVWATQEKEQGVVCFGAFEPSCSRACRWYDRCKLVSSEPLDPSTCSDGRTSQTKPDEAPGEGFSLLFYWSTKSPIPRLTWPIPCS